MSAQTFDSNAIRVARTPGGCFKVTLKTTGDCKIASATESHHFGRVLAALTKLKLQDLSWRNAAAAEDFATAVMGNANYFIQRMYFNSPPETIARWYIETPTH